MRARAVPPPLAALTRCVRDGALFLAILLLVATPRAAEADGSLTLYGHPEFGGARRIISADTPDLAAIGFNNLTSSIKIRSGTWILYRDRNYGGASITLGPGNYPHIDQLGLPNNTLSSIRLMPSAGSTAGLVAPPTITLYRDRNFGGGHRDITGEAADLTALGFDNATSSLIVHSGNWTLYRNDNFGATPDRPSVTIGPGEYSDIETVGFPNDKLSSIRGAPEPASNPVATAQCPGPYMAVGAGGACEFHCADGTEPDAATQSCICKQGFTEIGPDSAGRRRCAASTAGGSGGTGTLAPIGTALPGLLMNQGDGRCIDVSDAMNLAVAGIEASPCADGPAQRFIFTAEHQIQSSNGKCLRAAGPPAGPVQLGACETPESRVWTFTAEGLLKRAGGGCIESALLQSGGTILVTQTCNTARASQLWKYGPLASLQEPAESEVVPETDYLVPAGEAFLAAQNRGYLFRSEGNNSDCLVYGDIDGILLKNETTTEANIFTSGGDSGDCSFSLFGGRALAPGWSIKRTDLTNQPLAPHCDQFATDGPGAGPLWAAGVTPFQPNPGQLYWSSIQRRQAFVDPLHPIGCVAYPLRIRKITLHGPMGHDWHEAFAAN